MTGRWQAGLSLVVRVGLATMFAYAALSKLADPSAFARDIANYHLLSDALSGWAAVLFPVCELVIAAGLLLSSHARGAALLAALMLAGFAFAMGQAKLRGIDLVCGCFGGEARVSWGKVLLDLGLAGLALWVVAIHRPEAGRSQAPSEGSVA